MEKTSKKSKYAYILLRICAVLFFTGGFIYQAMEFMFMYWTYPTVVDIQQSSPTYLEIPAFTFCNRIGYIYDDICLGFPGASPCMFMFTPRFSADIVCKQYAFVCLNGTSLPRGFKIMNYGKFMRRYALTRNEFPKLAQRLEDYLTCSIEFAGKSEPCNMDNVLGSLYTNDDLPQFCYTIYSKWGQPEKEREIIPKGATMKFSLFLNISRKPLDAPDRDLYDYGFAGPNNNPPSDAAVQIGVHSPYFLPSPYTDGFAFMGGHNYEMRIKLSESHLLPTPYQTNCTDYMKVWHEREGKAPVNQLGIIQECRVNKTYEKLRCVPVTMDYPHEFDLCKTCADDDKFCEWLEPQNDCALLADDYNQPCDSYIYEVEKEDKVITIFQKAESVWADDTDGFRVSLAAHDCEGQKMWKPECSTINIDVPFDRFEITNITYNPKFESLELFSVIGGYMGMWLGISLLTVFDLFSDSLVWMKNMLIERQKSRVRVIKDYSQPQQQFNERRDILEGNVTTYNTW